MFPEDFRKPLVGSLGSLLHLTWVSILVFHYSMSELPKTVINTLLIEFGIDWVDGKPTSFPWRVESPLLSQSFRPYPRIQCKRLSCQHWLVKRLKLTVDLLSGGLRMRRRRPIIGIVGTFHLSLIRDRKDNLNDHFPFAFMTLIITWQNYLAKRLGKHSAYWIDSLSKSKNSKKQPRVEI